MLASVVFKTDGIHRACLYIGLLVMLYTVLTILAMIAMPETRNVDLEGMVAPS